ncbi:hypothetical protein YB2330_002859 [Saitoella coloradoensis]
MLDAKEVAKHNNKESCWVIISGNAYDVTDFLPDHPGGANIILRYAGRDATEEYDPIHPPGTIEESLPKEKHLGPVDPETIVAVVKPPSKAEQALKEKAERLRKPLSQCINLHDFEEIAEQFLSTKAWAYYSSSAEDTFTHTLNQESFSKILFRPRVMRNVEHVSLSTKFLGSETALPFFVAPAAMARLGHPDGELCITRGCGQTGLIQGVSANASIAFDTLANSKITPDQTLWYQLYVNRDVSKSKTLLKRVAAAGYKAILLTVDTAIPGKREADERAKVAVEMDGDVPLTTGFQQGPDQPQGQGAADLPQGAPSNTSAKPKPQLSVAAAISTYQSPNVSWADLEWIRESTGNLPIMLKGVQTVEDAVLAVEYGVQGIILSNHGGRQLDYAPTGLHTLLEIRKHAPWVLEKIEVYLDGGVRRGTDIIKALCLGARGVALGRPFLYALSAWGTEGVLRAIEILTEEMNIAMRLIGCTKLSDLGPHLVNTKMLDQAIVDDVMLPNMEGIKRWTSKL